jgi:hybrid polyketide synthase/nonribosomal peptide synthetase ACE1
MRMRSTEIGMDSLIAVDLRSWFLKNISVSIPVLEILSNISIADLVEQAVQKVPAKLTPNLTADGYPLPPQTQEPESSGSSSLDTPSSAGPPTPASEPSSISTPVASSNETQCQGHPKLIERSLKLSPTQSMFWVVHSLLEDKTTLNHTGMYKLTGPLRVSELKEAVVKLSNLHESLRTIFYQDEDGQVLQGILKQGPLELEHKFIASTANLEQEFEDIKNHVHDLGAGQLLRMVLLTLSPTENFLIIGIHHVNFDGMCVQILLRDLEALYSRRPLPQSVLQYGDFAERQRILASGGSSDSDLAFWRREFASVPKPLPLSCARIATRKPLDHYAVHAADVHLDANLAAKVRTISQSHRSTAFHFYLATFRILLQRLILDVEHNTQDLCIGIADSNRHELETLTSLGPYVNLLPLRFNNNPATFAACLASARDKTFSALAHATVPFEAVLHALRVSRDTRFAPLFQVFIDYRLGARERTSFVDCVVETLRFEPGRTAYDLSVDILDYQDGGALIRFFGQTTLYSESDVKAFAACYKSFLTSFVEQPGMALTVGDWQYPSGYLSKTLELSRGTYHSKFSLLCSAGLSKN